MAILSIPGVEKEVSRLALGTLTLTVEEAGYTQWRLLLGRFFELGGRVIDTAYIYNRGQSERGLGRWLAEHGLRDKLVIVDKGTHQAADGRWLIDPEHIAADLSVSLERLGVSTIDLYLLHRDNIQLPVGTLVECLNRHIDNGSIQAYGVSNWTMARIEEALEYAERHSLRPISANSPNVTLARTITPLWEGCVTLDAVSRQWHREHGLLVLAWSSQARGFFSGRFTRGQVEDRLVRASYDCDDNWERLRRVQQLAAEKGTTPARIALAWVLGEPYPILPLIGPLTVAELEDSWPALSVQLTPAERHWLNLEGE
ncbi:MAG: aldo/keto reductase [Chloroflexi bacterium]|nr:aldo/keto reductase [Chloroflexota bacterium]